MTRDELVWKMVKEFERRCTANYSQGNPVDSMSAVLRVCVDELLGDMRSAGDKWELIAAWVPERSLYMASWAGVNLLLKNRRARYSPPKPKTPEEVLRENLYAILAGTGSDVELYVRQIMELLADLKEQ